MKKMTVLFLLIFGSVTIHAQNYQISFAGTGASTTVDSVKVENLTQCTSLNLGGSDILHLMATVGINELNTGADNTMLIYPNPMTGNCSVDFEATAQGEATIGLYDISGKRILQKQELLSKGHHTYNLHGISSGIYMLKIESEQYFYTAKIVSNNASLVMTPDMNKQNSILNTAKILSLKGDKSVIDMQYNSGDILKLTGFSGGIYRTIFMLVPIQDQTVTFNFVACTDADGNNYSVVQIGTQIWMAENLNTTKYRDGTVIPNVTNGTAWSNLTTGAYCDYNNTPSNSTTYGKLYNWYAVDTSLNICPIGWHVPSDTEWTILTTYMGGESVAGGKMKETCSTHWFPPNTSATNESGFSALPGGYRFIDGVFNYIRQNDFWWSSTRNTQDFGSWLRYVSYDISDVYRAFIFEQEGCSIRCVKD